MVYSCVGAYTGRHCLPFVCLLPCLVVYKFVFCLFLTEESRRNYAKVVVHGYSWGLYWSTLFTICLFACLFGCLQVFFQKKSRETTQNQWFTAIAGASTGRQCLPIVYLLACLFVYVSVLLFVCLFLTREIRRKYAKPVVHGYSWGVYWPTLFTICLFACFFVWL